MERPSSIMMHHSFRSKEARHARKQKYRLRQTTSHSSLLVDRQGDVSRKLNQAFLLVDSFSFNFVDEERSDIYTGTRGIAVTATALEKPGTWVCQIFYIFRCVLSSMLPLRSVGRSNFVRVCVKFNNVD